MDINITHTGIIRRTDDLGRIVIPKEIRMKLRIQEGTAMEESVVTLPSGKPGILFTAYSPLGQTDSHISRCIIQALAKSLPANTCAGILDKYGDVVACARCSKGFFRNLVLPESPRNEDAVELDGIIPNGVIYLHPILTAENGAIGYLAVAAATDEAKASYQANHLQYELLARVIANYWTV